MVWADVWRLTPINVRWVNRGDSNTLEGRDDGDGLGWRLEANAYNARRVIRGNNNSIK